MTNNFKSPLLRPSVPPSPPQIPRQPSFCLVEGKRQYHCLHHRAFPQPLDHPGRWCRCCRHCLWHLLGHSQDCRAHPPINGWKACINKIENGFCLNWCYYQRRTKHDQRKSAKNNVQENEKRRIREKLRMGVGKWYKLWYKELGAPRNKKEEMAFFTR